jgi:hypothetical protein
VDDVVAAAGTGTLKSGGIVLVHEGAAAFDVIVPSFE